MTSKEQLEQSLSMFYGTTEYYRFHTLLLTEGVRFLAEQAECYWLLEEIFLRRGQGRLRALPSFTRWMLRVHEDRSATLSVGDGSNAGFGSFEIPYTDFPLPSITLYLEGNVLMLTTER